MDEEIAPARPLIAPGELRRRVGDLASEVSAEYPDGLVVVAVLKGSLIFLADLVRRLQVTRR